MGKTITIGVFTGDYKAITMSAGGAVIERNVLRVRPVSCTIPVGCEEITPDNGTKPAQSGHIEFYNTTNTCPTALPVSVAVNGKVVASIKPGEHSSIEVPVKGANLAVLNGKKRLMMTCTKPGTQTYEYYGCTDPRLSPASNGVAVRFLNTTEKCSKIKGFPIVIWIDGFPVKALKPSQESKITLSKGRHRIKVSKSLNGSSIFDKAMDCKQPFKFNYGCGKK